MAALGFTKARSVGPIAEAIAQAGSSVTRLFKKAELPIDLLNQPDKLLLLRDQARLLACAVDQLGDVALPAKLSKNAGALGLGQLGCNVCASFTLGEAIARAEVDTPVLLQTATWTGLARVDGGRVLYGYQITERIDIGRQINEILALGYLLDVARHFMGASWRPERVVLTGATLSGRSEIEAVFDCDVVLGGPKAGLILSVKDLKTVNPAPHIASQTGFIDRMPAHSDFTAHVEQLLLLGMGYERPSIEWLSGRLGLSRRTLQRRLTDEGVTFEDIKKKVQLERAQEKLKANALSISQVAFDLGYSDAAHFNRAFRSWTGMSPSAWRRFSRP